MNGRHADRGTETTTAELRRLLSDCAAAHEELGVVHGGHRTGSAQEGGRTTTDGQVLPIRGNIADHRHQLVQGLRHWLARCGAAVPLGSVHELAGRLVTATAALDPTDRDELRRNFTGWLVRAGRLIDLPPHRGGVPLPITHQTMPAPVGLTDSCAGSLRALLPADDAADPLLVCGACATSWPLTELPGAADEWVPKSAAAILIDAGVSTIGRWSRMGLIDTRDDGHVRLGDCIARRVSA